MRRQVVGRGDATVEVAWQRYVDLDAWSDWSPQIRGVRSDQRRLVPGLRGAVLGPVGLTVPFEILEIDEHEHRWRWQVQLLGRRIELTHLLDSEGGRTVATLVVDGPALLVLPYLPVAAVALGGLTRA